MSIADRKEIRNMSVPPQHSSLRVQIKQFCEAGTVSVSLNLSISGREEVGFFSYSEAMDTHNFYTRRF